MANPKCFIIMPITTPESALSTYGGDTEHFKHVLECLFLPAVKQAGFDAIPPNARGSDIIHGEIVKGLETADLVLCDTSCLNPNVFFELGVRTAVNKPVCLVKDKTTSTAPFDTAIIQHHPYSGELSPWKLAREVDDLCQHLKDTVTNSAGQNSLWKYFGLKTRAELTEPKDAVQGRLALLSDQVQSLAAQLDHITFAPDYRTSSNFEKAPKDRSHEALYNDLIELASEVGAVVKGMSTAGRSATLLVRPGTLQPDSAGLLSLAASTRGYDLTIIEGDMNKP
jgi:hypothetical protein